MCSRVGEHVDDILAQRVPRAAKGLFFCPSWPRADLLQLSDALDNFHNYSSESSPRVTPKPKPGTRSEGTFNNLGGRGWIGWGFGLGFGEPCHAPTIFI